MTNTELQKEPKNPVICIKDGKTYEPAMSLELSAPFTLKSNHHTVEVKSGETPVYFKRKILKVLDNTVSLYNIKNAIGICKDNKKIYCFLDTDGKTIEEVEECLQ